LKTGSQSRPIGPWLRPATIAGSLIFFVAGLAWLAAGFWLVAR
jgi:hypothetical protein